MDQRLQSHPSHESHNAAGPRIAFIQACWHKEIVDRGRDSFIAELQRLGGGLAVDTFEVPGSFEIPLPRLSAAAWWSMAASTGTNSSRTR